MADYAPDAVTVDGGAANVRNAASGDKLTDPGTHRVLRVNNGSASSITLTIAPPGTTSYNVTNPSKVYTIPNGTHRYIQIPASYGDPADGYKVALTWSATTTITFEYTRS